MLARPDAAALLRPAEAGSRSADAVLSSIHSKSIGFLSITEQVGARSMGWASIAARRQPTFPSEPSVSAQLAVISPYVLLTSPAVLPFSAALLPILHQFVAIVMVITVVVVR